MADLADKASEQAEAMLLASIANRRRANLVAAGNCHYCNEPCGSRLFCDAGCRDDYDHEQRMRSVGGLR